METGPKMIPTGVAKFFQRDEMIVTKTDLTGHITYANSVFLRVSGYPESEMLGQPHNIIRHPGMPKAVFRMMWSTLRSGQEFFGYIVNLAKSGDHYWVFAHVTPHFDCDGQITGFHSSRRYAHETAIAAIIPIYDQLLHEQSQHNSQEAGLLSSLQLFERIIGSQGFDSYSRFALSL